MNQIIDPRSRGFNYGAGWGTAPKPPVFHAASKLARDLAACARVMSDQAWALEMLLRDVRLAHTAPEKAAAVNRLAIKYAEYEAYLAQALEKVCEVEGARKTA